MDYTQKEEVYRTCDTFRTRQPLRQKKNDSYAYFSQIQDCISVLNRRKNELKQLKIFENNYKTKGQQQQSRIQQLQIQIEHHTQIDQKLNTKIIKIEKQINTFKVVNRQILKQIQSICKEDQIHRSQTNTIKKKLYNYQNKYAETEQQIISKQQKHYFYEKQLNHHEQQITQLKNIIRQKQHLLTTLQLEKTQLQSLTDYLKQRSILTMRSRNKVISDNKQIDYQISNLQGKLISLSKQVQNIEWKSEQQNKKNNQIDDINTKLNEDLEAVKKYYQTLQKTNKMLNNQLEQYKNTGNQVKKLISYANKQI